MCKTFVVKCGKAAGEENASLLFVLIGSGSHLRSGLRISAFYDPADWKEGYHEHFGDKKCKQAISRHLGA